LHVQSQDDFGRPLHNNTRQFLYLVVRYQDKRLIYQRAGRVLQACHGQGWYDQATAPDREGGGPALFDEDHGDLRGLRG